MGPSSPADPFAPPGRGHPAGTGRNRIGRAVAAGIAAFGPVLTGAGACDDGGPGVGREGEQGDIDRDYGTGGDTGGGNEGGAGDEIGGGG